MSDKILTHLPDCPQTFSFDIYICDDPLCGPHIIANDTDGEAICEMVIPLESTLELAERFIEIYKHKMLGRND